MSRPKKSKPIDPKVRLIPVGEVAEILGCSVSVVWKLLACKKVPEPVRFGGNTRWIYSEIFAWVKARCPNPSGWSPPENDVDI